MALCSTLPETVLAQINRVSWRRIVPAGRSLFSPEETSRLVANIVHGVVKLSTSLADGRTQIVGLQFASEFVGRPFSQSQPLLMEAATEVELCCFDRRLFESLLLEHKDLEADFMRRTMEELDEARQWMLLLGQKSAEERVASLLHLCASRSDVAATCHAHAGTPMTPASRIQLPLSRTEIGEFLGLTIETVGRMLKRLEKNGTIHIESGRGIRILDPARLVERSEQPRP